MTSITFFLEQHEIAQPVSTHLGFEEAAKHHLEKVWKVKLKRCNRVNLGNQYEPGIPDFYYEKRGIKTFVEVKCNTDALRLNQIQWMIKNPDVKKVLAWIYVEKEHHLGEMSVDDLKIPTSNIPSVILEAMGIINKIIQGEGPIHKRDILDKVKGQYTEDQVDQAVRYLMRVAEVYEPRIGQYEAI